MFASKLGSATGSLEAMDRLVRRSGVTVFLASAVALGLVAGEVDAAGPASSTPPAASAVAPATYPAACVSRDEIASWPARERVANLVMVGIPIKQISRAINLVRAEGVGGILVRGTPLKSDAAALRTLRDAGRRGPTFVAVDEEGGRVQHLKTAIGPLPSARVTAKTKTPAQLRTMVAAHGRAMKAMGFTMVLAPDVDLDPSPGAPAAGGTASSASQSAVGTNGIGDRSYGSNPETVAAYGAAFAQGMLDAGVVPVLKHFPGHGRASGDSHNVGATTPSLSSIKAADLIPFARILTDSRIGVMTAHLYVPGLDSEPASLSARAITQLLRGEIGHLGLIVSDSLAMWPIRYHYAAPEAAELALRAGNDVMLFDDEPSVTAVLNDLEVAITKDKKLAERVIDSNLRVMASKGRKICEAPTATPTTIVDDTSTITTTTRPASS